MSELCASNYEVWPNKDPFEWCIQPLKMNLMHVDISFYTDESMIIYNSDEEVSQSTIDSSLQVVNARLIPARERERDTDLAKTGKWFVV